MTKPYHELSGWRQEEADKEWERVADKMFPGIFLLTLKQVHEIDDALQAEKVTE